MLQAEEKKTQKVIQRGKELGVKELKSSTSHVWEGGGGNPQKSVDKSEGFWDLG